MHGLGDGRPPGDPGVAHRLVASRSSSATRCARWWRARPHRGRGPDAAGQVGLTAPRTNLLPDIEAEHVARSPDGPRRAGPTGRAPRLAARRSAPGRTAPPRPGRVRRSAWTAGTAGPGRHGRRCRLADVAEQQLLVHGPDERDAPQTASWPRRTVRLPAQAPRHPARLRRNCHCHLPHHRPAPLRNPPYMTAGTARAITAASRGRLGNRPPAPHERPRHDREDRPASGTGDGPSRAWHLPAGQPPGRAPGRAAGTGSQSGLVAPR